MCQHDSLSLKGSTLLELMLALAISLLIISFVVEIRLAAKRSEDLQSALHVIQDHARSAASFLRDDIHAAGYVGCRRVTHDFQVLPYASYALSNANQLSVNDKQALVIRHASLENVYLNNIASDHVTLHTSVETSFAAGDILIISDCQQAEIFQAANVSLERGQQKIIASQALRLSFAPQASINRLDINQYSIEKTKRTYANGQAVYALYVQRLQKGKYELVEGIDSMLIRYSITTDNGLVDVSADAVSDWSNVKGVAITLNVFAPPIKKSWPLYISLRINETT